MSNPVMVGYFEDEHGVLHATRTVREAGYVVHDVYTPYAVHGMDEAMGLRPSRLPWVTLLAGLTGLLLAIALQYYTSVTAWPINVGGKPFNSAPAFVPVAFEVTVLIAGLTTVAALLFRARLFPGATGKALPRVTDDRFALALCSRENHCDPDEVRALLQKVGAVEIARGEVAR